MYCEKKTINKMKMWKYLFVWGFVLITLMATSAAGASTSPGDPGQMIDKFEVEEEFGVRKALAMLGSLCDKNIVPSPNVDGVLAFRSLKNVTFEEAMDAILGDNFKYEQDGKLIKVYTKDEYKKIKEDPDRKIVKVVTLYYITAEEAQKLITPVLSADAQVQVSSPAEKTISGGAGGGSSGGIGSSKGGGDSMALNDTIVICDFPEKIAQAEEVLKLLDVRPKQVLVEATIMAALLDEDMELGIDWNFMGGFELDGYPAIDNSVGAPIEITGFASLTEGLRVGIQSGNTFGFINALEKVTDITILATPKILAVNKQEGSVLIGQNLGYRSSTSIGQGGVATEGQVKFLETGTQLVFRPYIGNDGYIRMEIYPKDSSAELDIDGVPQETTTELKTNILVKDGETVVIGGLFRDVVTTTRSQVPILGDLPIIGVVFRGTTDKTQREEVIIMLTPHIISESGQLDGEARADDVSRKKAGAKDGLNPLSRRKFAEDHYANAVRYRKDGDSLSAMKELCEALRLRPSYLEAMRLKERILSESSPDEVDKLERIMLDDVDKEEAPKWRRR
ncbi:MAG: type II secretion system protein GspD [Planctomycetota bacterium]|jgi:type II secretory pathway component GspD/PulD (secretin)